MTRHDDTRLAIAVAALSILWFMGGFVLAALLLTSCAHALPVAERPAKPLEVKIVNLPESHEVPQCWLPARPEAPRPRELNYDDADIMSRTMVHWHEWGEMVEYAQRMNDWAEEVEHCVMRITGQE